MIFSALRCEGVNEETRKFIDALVRLALGMEDVDDLIFDLKQALDKI